MPVMSVVVGAFTAPVESSIFAVLHHDETVEAEVAELGVGVQAVEADFAVSMVSIVAVVMFETVPARPAVILARMSVTSLQSGVDVGAGLKLSLSFWLDGQRTVEVEVVPSRCRGR